MTMIRPETEMKDTGIEWIGIIPSSWTIFPANGVFSEVKEKNMDLKLTNAFSFKYGEIVDKKQVGDVDNNLKETLSSYTIVRKNTIMINGLNLNYDFVSQRVAIVNESGVITSAYLAIQPDENKINPRFVLYLLKSYDYQQVFHGLGSGIRKTLKYQDFKKIMIVAPTLSEQQAIADYLDETCSQIDEIITEAKASIDEYEKLKQATIDENILGYDSVHIKLRQLGSLKNGLNFSHSDDVANIKFLGVGCFKDNMILSEVDDFADEHIDFEISEEYLLSDGDIVFVRSNGSKELVGRSIMVENIDYPVTFSGFCIRFRNMHTELVDNRFLLYYFRTTHFKQSLLKYSNDSTNINNLNQEMLNAIRINAPVIAEQKLLVKKMEEQVFVFDSLIAEKESLINDLEAYKKSLIYEVVTGKRRVV